ncbi:MAG: hypothetical protein ACXACC_05105 [Promethearchaeota archaeon]
MCANTQISKKEKILLTEYKELSSHLRERHQTIWQVRYISVLAITALIAGYYLKMREFLSPFRMYLVDISFLTVWFFVEIRYYFNRKKLLFRLSRIEFDLEYLDYYKKKQSNLILDIVGRIVIYLAFILASLAWIR